MDREVKDLVQRVLDEQDAGIREQLIQALVGFKQLAIKHIVPHITNDNWQIRYRMIKIIAMVGIENKDDFLAVEKSLENEQDESVREIMQACLINSRVCITTEFSERVDSTKKLKQIPKFSEDEVEKIKDLFDNKKIIFREHVSCYGHPEYPSYREEVVFEVVEDQFAIALEIIENDFFGVGSGSGFSGDCPACGANVSNVTACPECELKLELDPEALMEYHPFGDFLAKEKEK